MHNYTLKSNANKMLIRYLDQRLHGEDAIKHILKNGIKSDELYDLAVFLADKNKVSEYKEVISTCATDENRTTVLHFLSRLDESLTKYINKSLALLNEISKLNSTIKTIDPNGRFRKKRKYVKLDEQGRIAIEEYKARKAAEIQIVYNGPKVGTLPPPP